VKILLGLIVLLLLALAAGPRIQRKLTFSRRFFLVGGEFLLLGWALGGQGLGLLDSATLGSLEPLLILGLGWIGLLVGLQFELPLLRRVPLSFYGVAIVQALLVLGILYLASYPLLSWIFGPGRLTQAAALFLAAAGADSSQHILALAVRERRHHPHAPVHLYQVCAEIDTLVPLFALAVLAGFQRELAFGPPVLPDWGEALWRLAQATGFGLILGLLLAFLLHRVKEASHHLLILVGFLALSGGLSRAAGFPPLFVNFVAGALTVNLVGHRGDTWRLVSTSERPIYFIFLLLVGAGWHLEQLWALAIAPVFVILRLLAKSLSLPVAGRLIFGRRLIGTEAGRALGGQSGVSVALVASLQFIERGPLAETVYSVVLVAFLVSALTAPGLSFRALQRGVQS
jgi:hypothetical protein